MRYDNIPTILFIQLHQQDISSLKYGFQVLINRLYYYCTPVQNPQSSIEQGPSVLSIEFHSSFYSITPTRYFKMWIPRTHQLIVLLLYTCPKSTHFHRTRYLCFLWCCKSNWIRFSLGQLFKSFKILLFHFKLKHWRCSSFECYWINWYSQWLPCVICPPSICQSWVFLCFVLNFFVVYSHSSNPVLIS